ncbi:MAG: ThiF family adenylyltransferase [Phycisphaerae bacterium]|nr:ThiF family adenylyltransferase [Phycisphaerae bacterium]
MKNGSAAPHPAADIGTPKTHSATAKLHALNPDIIITPHTHQVTAETLTSLLTDYDYDFAIDATDSHQSRQLINRAAHATQTPYIFAGVHRLTGMAMTILPYHTACYDCAFGHHNKCDFAAHATENTENIKNAENVKSIEIVKPTDTGPLDGTSILNAATGLNALGATPGILGVTSGLLGTLQAAEAIKYLLGHGDLLTNRLLTINLATMTFRHLTVRRHPQCPTCRSR